MSEPDDHDENHIELPPVAVAKSLYFQMHNVLRTHNHDFLTLWKDADPDIPIYK